MNAGQHLGNTKKILENLGWDSVTFNDSAIIYFQVLNWLPDYVSLIDLFSGLVFTGFVDYIPIYLPFLGYPSFNFFSMKRKLVKLSQHTICTSEEKIFHNFHFDSLTSLKSIQSHWNWLEEISKKWLNKIDKEQDESNQQLMLFSLLAQTLHAVQDFYSHSNWIEQLHEIYQFTNKEEFLTWFDIFKNENGTNKTYKEQIEQKNIYTGYFPIGKDQKIFHIYHNDKKNMPGLNKDRAERPFFDVVYYLAMKNGIQWLNYLKESLLKEKHIKLLNKPISGTAEKISRELYPYIKKLSFKIREFNGTEPFKNLSMHILEAKMEKNILFLTLQLKTSENLTKYDRDFRKSFFKIIIESDENSKAVFYKFGHRSGLNKLKLNVSEIINFYEGGNQLVKVEYGLLIDQKIIIKKN